MTTTPADMRYGRRGGGWLPTPPATRVVGACQVCKTGRATHHAQSTEQPDEAPWAVCDRCADTGRRHRAQVRYTPLEAQP